MSSNGNGALVEQFWAVMGTNDFVAASELLHEDYVLEWPQSGERLRGAQAFAEVNAEYPAAGEWRFAIQHLVVEGDLVVSDVLVTDGERQDRAITFSTIRDGRIRRQIEFWPDPMEAPAWRSRWVEQI